MAKKLEHASPLTIMDRALEEFGNDIAIAFRYFIKLTSACREPNDCVNVVLIKL